MSRAAWLRGTILALIAGSATLTGAQQTPRPPAASPPIRLVGGTSYAPLSYVEDGEAKGIKIDLANAMSRVLGREIRIELTDWETARERVLRGDADAVLTMSPTAERVSLYDFSEPTMTHEWGLFVRRGETAIWDVTDLDGRTVGVTAASLPRPFLTAATTATLSTVDTLDEGFSHLAEGTIDAIAADLWVGAYTIERRGLRNIVRSGPPFATSTSAFAVRKGNHELLAELNRAIRAVKADGTLDGILARWRPKEMVFLSRERMTRLLILVISGFLGLLLLAATMWGMTLRKQLRAQAGRERAEERYRQVVENANDIIFTVDREGFCLSMNRAGQLLSGYVADNPRGVNLKQLVVPEHTATAQQHLQRVLAGEDVPRFELDILSRQRKRLTLELDVHAIREGTAIVGVQGIARDITARKELEARFLQAQKMEAIGRLAGGVAHDFNNILTVVMGCAELAAQQLRPANPLRPDLEEIQRAAGSGAALTRQLLMFSRKSVIRPAVLDPNDIIERLNKMLRRLVGEDIALVVRPGGGVGHVAADAGQLEQVVMNLVVNARDAMPAGGTITVDTGMVTLDETAAADAGVQAGEFVTLIVTDAGCGMPPHVQARIFEPFFTTKGPGTGTGLGLPTVHAIVRQAGGAIRVASIEGVGTTFTILLPKVAAPAGTAPLPQWVPMTTRASGTILYAEDEDSIRAIGTRVLSERGYTVIAARHAEEALALAAHHSSIDLLLTDIVMPGINGVALAEQLRLDRPGLSVLYTSGYTDDSAALRQAQADDAAFLQKPFSPESLVREVQRVLRTSGPRRMAS